MIGVAVAPIGLKIKSSILTRRGGTDANAPERLRTAILRDWHVGIVGPIFWRNLGNAPEIIPKEMKLIFTGP